MLPSVCKITGTNNLLNTVYWYGAQEFDCIEFYLISRRAFFFCVTLLRAYRVCVVGGDVVRPYLMYFNYCACTTCQLCTSGSWCTFVR